MIGGIVAVLVIICCAGCLVLKLVNKRSRNGHVPEVIDQEDCPPDVQLLNLGQQFSDTAPSTVTCTCNRIECSPTTSEEDIKVV